MPRRSPWRRAVTDPAASVAQPGAAGRQQPPKVLVTGSRKQWDSDLVWGALDAELWADDDTNEIVVIHGCADGADTRAQQWCVQRAMPEMRFPARWRVYGKAAGPIRNRQMFDVTQPDVVLAFPLADSIGTWDMVQYAEAKGCPVKVFQPVDATRGEQS